MRIRFISLGCFALLCGYTQAGILLQGEGTGLRISSHQALLSFDASSDIHTWCMQYDLGGKGGAFVLLLPTPMRGRIEAAPGGLFGGLMAFTRLKQREQPRSVLLGDVALTAEAVAAESQGLMEAMLVEHRAFAPKRARELYSWLADRRVSSKGRESTIAEFALGDWYLNALYFDTHYMGRAGAAAISARTVPVVISFRSERPAVYPLRSLRSGVSGQLPVTFYLHGSTKLDLPDDLSYQFAWLDQLRRAQGRMPRGEALPWGAQAWYDQMAAHAGSVAGLAKALGFDFERGSTGASGIEPTRLEWCKRLTSTDISLTTGDGSYSEALPNVDEGYEGTDRSDRVAMSDAADEIERRVARSKAFKPEGYLWRVASDQEFKAIGSLRGLLKEGQVLTRLRRRFQSGELAQNIEICRAGWDRLTDESEYVEVLPAR